MERTANRSRHTKLTLEKKILPPLLPGLELATFRSRVQRSYQQAVPASILNTAEIKSTCDALNAQGGVIMHTCNVQRLLTALNACSDMITCIECYSGCMRTVLQNTCGSKR